MDKQLQPKELVEVFAENLRERRIELGLSQAALAAAIQAHAPYISDLERGVKAPYLGTLARIADALDTTPSVLLSARKKMTIPS